MPRKCDSKEVAHRRPDTALELISLIEDTYNLNASQSCVELPQNALGPSKISLARLEKVNPVSGL